MSIKVLVADDSITIQKVIGIIFGGDEYSLTVVDNGKSAVDKAREIDPDILLIDALMPGMTGYEVAEAVRSTPSLATKPILILTGSFEPFDEEKAKKCGADDFIAKPFESQQIITKVKELLELAASRTAAAPVSAPQPPPVPVFEPPQEIAVPAQDPPASTFNQQPSSLPLEVSAAPADIWGAFTPEIEQPVNDVIAPVAAETREPDVFAIVSEENDAQLVQAEAPAFTAPSHTGSQWVPVEENTFEFEEVDVDEPPQAPAAVQETAFGDISFEETAVSAPPAFNAVPEPPVPGFVASAPVFEVPAAPPEPFTPLADPTPVCAAPAAVSVPASVATDSVALTEEQLRAALAGASKDVIERIVWEVVPDLAEALIREAIRKIKDGV